MIARGETPPLTRIAFGSCNKPWLANPLWKPIRENQPQAWIWLGDIVYGGGDLKNLAQLYASQKASSDYQRLRASCSIFGVWDDNDYGESDGGADFAHKSESQKLLLDFLDEPAESPRRKQHGVYASHTLGTTGRQVKILLLDGRYFREKPGANAEMLGEEQWAWLEQQLTNSDEQVHLIGSGSQVLSCEHLFEKWGDYPKSRQRLLDLLVKTKPRCPVILSGDRHLGEISRIAVPGLPGPLYDITSSGMTHFAAPAFRNFFYDFHQEPNRYRVGDVFCGVNFGTIEIDWTSSPPQVMGQIHDEKNVVRCAARIQ
ncbi:MAG: alkaline phosphatase [Chthoniobacter sp.]|nr:alkaline phosphatase [Chthoniobacter sp.]